MTSRQQAIVGATIIAMAAPLWLLMCPLRWAWDISIQMELCTIKKWVLKALEDIDDPQIGALREQLRAAENVLKLGIIPIHAAFNVHGERLDEMGSVRTTQFNRFQDAVGTYMEDYGE